MLEYNDNVHIYPEKNCSVNASCDNRRTAILSVFIFSDDGAGVGNLVSILQSVF